MEQAFIPYFLFDRLQQPSREMPRYALRDEDDARGVIVGWPSLQEFRRGDHVLHAVDHRWLVWHFLDVHQAFQTQQARAAMFGQRFEQQGQGQRGHWAVAAQRESRNVAAVIGGEGIALGWRRQVSEPRRNRRACEQHARRCVLCRACHCAGVEVGQASPQRLARLGNICLAQQQRVRECDLPACFRMAPHRRLAVRGIDDGDDAVDRVELGEVPVGHQRVQDGRGIGQAGGLDQYAVIADLTGLAPALQVEQRRDEIAAHSAAQAARGQGEQCLVAAGDQFVVQADLAELVDDDGGAGEGGIAQDAGDQRGLATAEKAGDDGDRNNGSRRQWTALC